MIISRDFFLFLLEHADGDRIAPFLNNRHYRFQFVDNNWYRISPELYDMNISTLMDQHIKASPHQLQLIKLLLFQKAIRQSIIRESASSSMASGSSTEDPSSEPSSSQPAHLKNVITRSPRYLRKTCSHLSVYPKQSCHVWTKEEDQLLENAVKQYGFKHWKEISQEVGSRNAVQCRQRYFTLHRSHRVVRKKNGNDA